MDAPAGTFWGKDCKRKHGAPRRIDNRTCTECARERARKQTADIKADPAVLAEHRQNRAEYYDARARRSEPKVKVVDDRTYWGAVCKRGHNAPRRVDSRACTQCLRENAIARLAVIMADPEKHAEYKRFRKVYWRAYRDMHRA